MTKKIILHQKRQFNPHVINELAKKTVSFSEIESYVTILFDEMKIQENLVWDKHSGKLIMFVDISDININYNYATLENVQKCYTCFSVFSQKCCEPIILQFCNFCRFQIMSIFWQAVKYLERIKLKLIAATADGASQNKFFFSMHKYLCGDSDADVIYRTRNIHTKEVRFIYFFADSTHLVKTSRNCLYHCGSGRGTR